MTIFLPVRNGGSHLTQAIDSVRAQTVADWRLVVLENGSTDDSVARVNRYRDERIILLPAPVPLGIEANWRRATPYIRDHVDGDGLVTFIGHDDLFAPSFVATIAGLRDVHPDATLYQTHFDLIDGEGGLIRPCRPIPQHETGEDLAAQLLWAQHDSYGTGYAFRARDHLRVGGWPDLPRLLYADHLLFIRLTALGHKATSPVTGCSYRLHTGSMSGGTSAAKLTDSLHALAGFVAALDAEMPDFVASEQGRNALARRLASELGQYHLLPAKRALDEDARVALRRLDERLATIDRGLPASSWTRTYGPRSKPGIDTALFLLRSLKSYRAMRR